MNSFEVWYLKNGSTIGQVHGSLSVTPESISLNDENNQQVFTLTPEIILSIHNDVDRVTIQSAGNTYILLVQNRIKSAGRVAVLGPIFGVGGKSKNALFSPAAQGIAEELAATIKECGYPISFERAKLTRQQIIIVTIVAILLTVLVGLGVISQIVHNPGKY